ncbi:MAG: hypothetical protein ACK4NV_03000 [Pannonibacter sp.]
MTRAALDPQAVFPRRRPRGPVPLAYGTALVLTYLVTGVTRSQVLDDRIGMAAGALAEAGLFLASGIACLAVLSRRRTDANASHPAAAGLIALGLFLLADGVIAVWLCGLSLSQHMLRFAELAGMIQFAGLALYALLPSLWHWPD